MKDHQSVSTLLSQYFFKATGEGSRGGHIIGHTRNGRPIYSPTHSRHSGYKGLHDSNDSDSGVQHDIKLLHSRHKGWSFEDHVDASDAHRKQAELHYNDRSGMRHMDWEEKHNLTRQRQHLSGMHAHAQRAHLGAADLASR